MKQLTFFLAMAMALVAMAAPLEQPKYVILITIDGLRAQMVDDPLMPSPFLKMMSRDGLRVERVMGIPPAETYPSHTTIVTGATPAGHHIYYNRPFLWNKDTARISYWWADSIAVPTIWQKAHEAGMDCCFGYQTKEDCVSEVLYGVRARGSLMPPKGLQGYRYERALDGSGYWVLRQRV